ncbi:acetyl-CoA carboxylase, carboxyltransferase subunit beta [Ligilactobacillus apodemi]|uniref:Acetyl-coenzyme A carboxylase carboxyl transferase subunit beta n=1 Tax=Ligilactobacillus apodemi DSM 16634 = JCM 16172 TaxID=1423724 RepID=A0A0R1TYS2_9LACO|nr:acetyl-CoA carboxylase, carboxyltransferase subunit beta [Ligilactobacillus apodemi]KRL84250.1 Acetyl-coenzyme A carboxylase carboxyl transferase subunit beta [Ligilactobacillus apodemi DSM 16634 = JCM 16172]MCR1901295.1 acetyl-CoA carboxylase, carboxyltransferase subunit beta [Ligilactobacillus apodemi]
MKLFEEANTLQNKQVKANKAAEQKVPAGLWIACPKCGYEIFHEDVGLFHECPQCFYGFRIKARERLTWLVDSFEELDSQLDTDDPLNFPGYQTKLTAAKQKTELNDSILTGIATISGQKCALAIMDPYFIMGSLGKITGEKLTRLFEKATKLSLPVIVFTASGGARMQEGINSLMQMVKVSNAVAAHSAKGLLYISVLTDPTTGGVTASFAMQGDLILAEPHAMIGFAGKRVIEQTIHQKIPDDLQSAETVLKNGFVDAIVKRHEQKKYLARLLKFHQGGGKTDVTE